VAKYCSLMRFGFGHCRYGQVGTGIFIGDDMALSIIPNGNNDPKSTIGDLFIKASMKKSQTRT